MHQSANEFSGSLKAAAAAFKRSTVETDSSTVIECVKTNSTSRVFPVWAGETLSREGTGLGLFDPGVGGRGLEGGPISTGVCGRVFSSDGGVIGLNSLFELFIEERGERYPESDLGNLGVGEARGDC